MDKFFSLNNSNPSYEINIYEKFIPLIIVTIIISIIYFKREQIRKSNSLDKLLRYLLSIISSIFLIIYYSIEWSTNGINVNNLPFHLCFISNIFCILLCFTKDKKTFNFVIFTGVLGGISSLLAPTLDLSYKYFRYYQFMICHGSIIIIPLYFFIIYKYNVSIKDTISVILTTEILGLILGIFNEYFNTTYMFVSFSSNQAAKDSILYYIGDGYMYFLNLQIIFIFVMLLWYLILNTIYKLLIKDKKK